jgi:cell division protein FtsB
MILAKANTYEFGVRKRTLERSVVVGPISMRLLTVLLVALVVLFYLAQSSQSATKSYRVYELQQQQAKLESEHKRLELEAIRLRSLNEVQKNSSSLKLEPGSVRN